ncbi:MAG: hypothetical protein HQ455_10495 [Burkholderiales bacterium]|nr:hypothetical protein [Burkholderiales bacterium]
MKRIFTLWLHLLLLGLVACTTVSPITSPFAPKPHQVVLGSNSFGFPQDKMTVLGSTQGQTFETRHSTLRHESCAKGIMDIVEFSGTIDPVSLQSLQAHMNNLSQCINSQGQRMPPQVYLNSNAGKPLLGIELGQVLGRYGVEAVVTEGQICSGACAVGFLTARQRSVKSNGRVVLYFNGAKNNGFDCARSNDMMPLKNHFLVAAGRTGGTALYNQALTYCNSDRGWEIS